MATAGSGLWIAGNQWTGTQPSDILAIRYELATGPAVSALTLAPATFSGGCQSSSGRVTLSAPAPAGGTVVALASTNPVAVIPASVTVPAGQTSATFPITAPAVSSLQTGTVSATAGAQSRSATLRVRPIGVLSLVLGPNGWHDQDGIAGGAVGPHHGLLALHARALLGTGIETALPISIIAYHASEADTRRCGVMWKILMTILLAVPAGAAAEPQETGRLYTEWFYAGKVAELWERFTPEMKGALGTVDALQAFRGQIADQLGTEERVLSEKVVSSPPYQVYIRTVRFGKAPTPVIVQWSLDQQNRVAGFFIRPQQEEAPTQHLEYRTKTPLRLPFAGEWYVFWGGRTLKENYHTAVADQRFAYDFVIRRDGKSHTGDGGTNDQYHCFGQPVLAPGPGKVAVAVGGIDDNRPGQMNPRQPPGNHVVIDHGNGEFSFLAHFKKASLTVKPGDTVKAGDRLGLCGNSGNSSEPHLHYHLQTTAKFGEGEGLPAQFLDYLAGGKKVERGEPVQGQTVRQQEPAPPSR